MRPEFGSRLRDFLFEAATPATVVAIAAEVEQAVNACEPRVQVGLVEVVPDASVDGLLHLTIHYRRRDTGEPQELVVDFATDRHPDLVEPAPGPAEAVADGTPAAESRRPAVRRPGRRLARPGPAVLPGVDRPEPGRCRARP